jgi:hypothetical protein
MSLRLALLLFAAVAFACSGEDEEPSQSTTRTPPPPALWAAYGSNDNDVGFALRVEPGPDLWTFRLDGDRLLCPATETESGWHFESCSGLPEWLRGFQADVPATDGDPMRVRLDLEGRDVNTWLRRLPERDEPPSSSNVELVWHHQLSPDCRVNAGVWAADGLVFAACFAGFVEIFDASTGAPLGRAQTADAPLGGDSAALEVTARDGVLYVATTGRGVVAFDVSDPAAPRQIGQYFVEAPEGSPDRVTNIHTLTLSPDGRQLFAINQSHPRSDVRILDVSNPASIREAGVFLPPAPSRSFGFSHDISLEERDGRLIAYFYQLAGGFYALDATDPRDVRVVGALSWPRVFSHSGWPFEVAGRRYLAHADEGFDQGLTVIDVTNAGQPRIVSTFKTREGVSIHNLRVIDGIAYISYYIDGLRVVDLRDPANPKEVGHYDTVAATDETGIFDGAWGVHVDGGLIYVSDMSSGVYAFRFTGAP